MLAIDGSHGEGGGQILRTALSLSVITGHPVKIHRIRAQRPNPGLAAQHLAVVRAMAVLSEAKVQGDSLGSQELEFHPGGAAKPGTCQFDVAAAREGGSAGSVSLLLQAVLLPLTLVNGVSHLTIKGGTHVAWSPPFDYVHDVWLPTLARTGIDAEVALKAWGWFPIGQGEISVTVPGQSHARRPLGNLNILDRGPLRRITGRAVVASLAADIAERIADRARTLLKDLTVEIKPVQIDAACPGAGLFLVAECANIRSGFSSLGAKGKAVEMVAEEAVAAFLAYRKRQGALEQHLADQVLLPLSLADEPSRFTAERRTSHLETNAWVIEQFGLAKVGIESTSSDATLVTIEPGSSVARETESSLAEPAQCVADILPWNAIVTVHESEWRTARRLLSKLGSVTPTEFHNVLVMNVEDPERFVEQLILWIEREPGLLSTFARVVPAQRSFAFCDADSFEVKARRVLSERLGELAGKSFHLRVHQRGLKAQLSSQNMERYFGTLLLEALEAADHAGRIDFEDPDIVVLIETIGQRAGVWFCSRQDRHRLPFLGPT